jgi:hypothetical protein
VRQQGTVSRGGGGKPAYITLQRRLPAERDPVSPPQIAATLGIEASGYEHDILLLVPLVKRLLVYVRTVSA